MYMVDNGFYNSLPPIRYSAGTPGATELPPGNQHQKTKKFSREVGLVAPSSTESSTCHVSIATRYDV